MTKVRLKGRWRIVETKLWDKDFLDLMEPAYIAFDGKTGRLFTMSDERGPAPPPPPGGGRAGRGAAIPGSFTILMIGR